MTSIDCRRRATHSEVEHYCICLRMFCGRSQRIAADWTQLRPAVCNSQYQVLMALTVVYTESN